MIAPRAALLVLVLALAGCGSVELHELVLRAPSATPARPAPAEVYLATRPPTRPFAEVALLQAVGHGSDANLESTMAVITRRASALGCDAVVNAQFDIGATMAHAYGVCVTWVGTPAR